MNEHDTTATDVLERYRGFLDETGDPTAAAILTLSASVVWAGQYANMLNNEGKLAVELSGAVINS